MLRYISKRARKEKTDEEQMYMVKKNLFTMKEESTKLLKLLDGHGSIPEWCQEKLAVAAKDLDTVFEYMSYDLDSGDSSEEDEEEDN
jgi:hypothetical protein